MFRYIFYIQRRKRPLIENEYMIRIINHKYFLLLKNCLNSEIESDLAPLCTCVIF